LGATLYFVVAIALKLSGGVSGRETREKLWSRQP